MKKIPSWSKSNKIDRHKSPKLQYIQRLEDQIIDKYIHHFLK